MNFFDHKNLGHHLLQLCPKVVKHPVYEPLPEKKTDSFLTFPDRLQYFVLLEFSIHHLQVLMGFHISVVQTELLLPPTTHFLSITLQTFPDSLLRLSTKQHYYILNITPGDT